MEDFSTAIPGAKKGGHPQTTDMRAVCNAIYDQLKTGCQWELLPRDFLPSSTVYSYYRKWQRLGNTMGSFNHRLYFTWK